MSLLTNAPLDTPQITNSGATMVSGLTLMAQQPGSSVYMSAKASPKLPLGGPNPLVDGTSLHWSGISVAPRKTQTLMLAVAISSCADDTAVINANVTGANSCVTMAPAVQTTLKRSHKDKPCATAAPSASHTASPTSAPSASPSAAPTVRGMDWIGLTTALGSPT